MASTFPGAIDSFTDPLSGSPLNSPSHSAQHADLNDAAEKLETYMGLVKVIPTGATNGTVGATGTVTIGNAVSSVSVNGCFSSLYNNYQILVSGGSSSGNFTTRLTLGATATGYYFAGAYCTYANVVSGSSGANQASWLVTSNNTNANMANIFLSQPFLAAPTAYSTNYYGVSTGDGAIALQGYLNNSTSYTAFTLTSSGGTFTGGTITVYGYRI
jgi:hypothetical protein